MNILISGGGIAGLTAANLLQKSGHSVTVIDKAHEFTNAGFVLSLKSFGVEILDELGLKTELKSKATTSKYVNFLQPSGKLIRSLSYDVINQRLSKSIFATRDGIHKVILNSVKDIIKLMMTTTIASVNQIENGIQVTLSNGEQINADLLIISEGLHSTTRQTYFKSTQVNNFNIFYLAGRVSYKHNYDLGVFKSFMGVKKMLAILPLSETEIALQCYLHTTTDVETLQSNTKQLLQDSYAEFDEEVQNIIKEVIEKGTIFSDKMGMVHSENLVNGRMVLLGDAGYCPTALSGMGASLSIYGAKALTHFINQQPENISVALKHYNDCLKPVIEKFQNNAKKNATSFLPHTKFKHFIFNLLFRIIPQSLISLRMSRELGLTVNQKEFVLG